MKIDFAKCWMKIEFEYHWLGLFRKEDHKLWVIRLIIKAAIKNLNFLTLSQCRSQDKDKLKILLRPLSCVSSDGLAEMMLDHIGCICLSLLATFVWSRFQTEVVKWVNSIGLFGKGDHKLWVIRSITKAAIKILNLLGELITVWSRLQTEVVQWVSGECQPPTCILALTDGSTLEDFTNNDSERPPRVEFDDGKQPFHRCTIGGQPSFSEWAVSVSLLLLPPPASSHSPMAHPPGAQKKVQTKFQKPKA